MTRGNLRYFNRITCEMSMQLKRAFVKIAVGVLFLTVLPIAIGQEITPEDWQLVRQLEQKRILAIEHAAPSVIAIYGDDRSGGGSGVVIDPSGIALTNHHVIMGAGISGWGGMADGKMYRWHLIGTDPGGDVSVIQMEGRDDFPFTHLADSDKVRVGDWALAMGNPFVLTEDQYPTVTLGIVSGVQRYQPGAGNNQLVYGNCIQVDSSINPGNSGGPLFDLNARIMGINGRGSFQDRGRVNVGLGYAISANQIKNFLPDLLATKLTEHGSLDANFSNRGGKVVCSTINELSRIAQAGLALGDELLEFERIPISSANQFTNLICTLPADWPASLRIRKADGKEFQLTVRLLGLPYARPKLPPETEKPPSPEEQQARERQRQMVELLRADPGTVRNLPLNQRYAEWFINQIKRNQPIEEDVVRITDEVLRQKKVIGRLITTLGANGRFYVEGEIEGRPLAFEFDGTTFYNCLDEDDKTELSLTEAKITIPIVQALGISFMNRGSGFSPLGEPQLDGSDKANGLVSARIKFLDSDQDWFYAWVSLPDDSKDIAPSLVRASSEKDCDHRRGGVVFDDYREQDGWLVPHRRRVVAGLGEEELFVFETRKVQILPNARPTATNASEHTKSSRHYFSEGSR